MGLPKNIRPEYSTTIPSTGKKIKYQPFSIKEEKVLIVAAEGQDADEIANAVSNVLRVCITSPADIDVESLALFDIEYLFLKARSKSAGEKVTVNITDPDDPDYTVSHDIDIDRIGIKRTEGHTDLIEMEDNISVKMRYPGIGFFGDGLNLSDISSSLNTIAKCVSQIVVGEEVYNSADMSQEEIAEWLEGLTTGQLGKIMEFFNTMPRLSHTLNLDNKKKGTKFSVTLEGLADFF